jgi:hypothetical protein
MKPIARLRGPERMMVVCPLIRFPNTFRLRPSPLIGVVITNSIFPDGHWSRHTRTRSNVRTANRQRLPRTQCYGWKPTAIGRRSPYSAVWQSGARPRRRLMCAKSMSVASRGAVSGWDSMNPVCAPTAFRTDRCAPATMADSQKFTSVGHARKQRMRRRLHGRMNSTAPVTVRNAAGILSRCPTDNFFAAGNAEAGPEAQHANGRHARRARGMPKFRTTLRQDVPRWSRRHRWSSSVKENHHGPGDTKDTHNSALSGTFNPHHVNSGAY